MSEKLKDAIDTMAEQISAKLAEVAELKRSTNTLCRLAGIDPLYPDDTLDNSINVKMRPDEYYGQPFATAVRMYLQRRRHAVSGEEIMRGLEQGNYDFDAAGWKPETRLRAVASSLAKNTAIFHKLPNGLFGLKEWYPAAVERKRGKRNDEPEEGEEAVSE